MNIYSYLRTKKNKIRGYPVSDLHRAEDCISVSVRGVEFLAKENNFTVVGR